MGASAPSLCMSATMPQTSSAMSCGVPKPFSTRFRYVEEVRGSFCDDPEHPLAPVWPSERLPENVAMLNVKVAPAVTPSTFRKAVGRASDRYLTGLHAHVIDAVRARRHARDQAADLQARVRPAVPAGADVLGDQVVQPGALGEGHDGDQPGVRHQMRVIERRAGLPRAMQQSHVKGVLSARYWKLRNSHSPSSEGTFHVNAPERTST